MAQVRIDLPMDAIAEFCKRWKIQELALFGSVLRDDFRPDSDVDVLVTFAPDARFSLLDYAPAQDELTRILGRPTEIVNRRAIEGSDNPWRRRDILRSARTIYAA